MRIFVRCVIESVLCVRLITNIVSRAPPVWISIPKL